MIHIGKRYAKDDVTSLIISSYKSTPYENKAYGAKRTYYVHSGNDTAGWLCHGRFFNLSKARKEAIKELHS